MKQRAVAVAGILGLGAIAATPVAAGTRLGAGSGPSLCAPRVSGATAPDPAGHPQRFGMQGATVTVTGSNFEQPGCSVSGVTLGAAAIQPSAIHVTSNSALTFALPHGASGPVSVAATDMLGNRATSNSNFVFIETPSAAVESVSPVEGSTEAVAGSGYAPFVSKAPGSVSGAGVSGTYTGCGSTGPGLVATPANDTSLTLAAPASYCDGTLVLTFMAPADTSRPMNCTAPATSPQANCIADRVDAGTVDVFFFVTSLSPTAFSSVHPGQVIHVGGSGFGGAGRAFLGGVAAPAAWGDRAIAVTVPKGAVTGELTLQRATGDLAVVQVASYVVSGTTPAPGGASGSGATAGASGPPGVGSAGIPGRAGAQRGSSAPGSAAAVRDSLTLSAADGQAAAGSTVALVVTLTADGKAVSGAPVKLSILSAPGRDAGVSPATGLTDGTGVFHATLRLSRKAGDHLLLATSGIYSDEAHVLGQAPAAASGVLGLGGLKIHLTGNPVIVGLAVATGVLLLLGVLVNVEVVRRAVWSFTIGRFVHRRRAPDGTA